MKTLDTTFVADGFTHTQIRRRGMFAVYERSKPGHHSHFEAVQIGSHNGFKMQTPKGEIQAAPAETYPPVSQWGSKGFTLPNREAAITKLDFMEAEAAKPKRTEAQP